MKYGGGKRWEVGGCMFLMRYQALTFPSHGLYGGERECNRVSKRESEGKIERERERER